MRTALIQRLLATMDKNEFYTVKPTVLRKGDIVIIAGGWLGALTLDQASTKTAYKEWLEQRPKNFFRDTSVETLLVTTHIIVIRLKKKVRRKTK